MMFTRLSFQKRSRIVHCFIEDVDATTASRLTLVNRKTVNAWYKELRRRLLPYASQFEGSSRSLKSYETKRLSKFYGLRSRDLPYHLAETRVRFELGRKFGAAVLDVADDLLSI